MYERLVTKSGDAIWMKMEQRFCRRDITPARFEFWDSLPDDVKAVKASRMKG